VSDSELALLFTVLSGLIAALAVYGRFSGPVTPASRRAVIAQYSPPAEVTVLEAAIVLNSRQRSVSAQIVDLTVRGVLRVLEPGRGRKIYRLQLADPHTTGVRVERVLIRAIFGRNRTVGQIVRVHRRNGRLAARLGTVQFHAEKAVATAGLIVDNGNRGWRLLLPIAQLVIVAPAMAWGAGLGLLPWLALAFGLGTVALAFGRYHVLTAPGVELRDHLLGLRAYIQLAEADRMRLLQGPETALTRGDVVVLTERLLGWAVLFGYGREWARLLEVQRQEAGLAPPSDLPVVVGFASTFDGIAPSGIEGDFSQDPDGDSGENGASGGFDFGDSGGGSGSDGAGDGGGGDGGGGD
jgi:uncharacterized membrane protein YgcG